MPSLSNVESLAYFVPELALAGFALVALVADLFLRGRSNMGVGVLTLLALVVVGAFTLLQPHDGSYLFLGMTRHDTYAQFLKAFLVVVTFTTVLVSLRSSEVVEGLRGEYYVLLLFATFGMFLMVSASNLLMAYLGIEMSSLSSYVLAGFVAGRTRSSEAAFKYVIYGAVASGVMLFGISLLYGMSGTADFASLGAGLSGAPPATLALAIVFVFAGLGYKIASVPFHMWSPDVYEGAPLPVTAFLSVASKAAGFGLAIRFFREGLGTTALIEQVDWPLFVALVSAVTMTVGNLAAFGQRNVKRLLAYSSIAHGGYLLMGVAVASQADSSAVASTLFYLVVYLFMNLGAFYVVLHLAEPNRLGSEEIEDYRGLVRRSPFVAVLMSIFLFSLIGLPPFAGFWGKFYLFKSVVDASLVPGGVNGHNFVWLVVLGLLNSAVSLYYYFSVVKAMLLDTGKETTPVRANVAFAALLLLLLLPTVLFGFFFTSGESWIPQSGNATAATVTSNVAP
jgi:NADH-quinone oxidoreductase subunit N